MACIDRYFLASTPNRVTHPNTGKFKDTIALTPVIPAIFRPEPMLSQTVKRSTLPKFEMDTGLRRYDGNYN